MKPNRKILKINESDLKNIVNILLKEATTKTQTVKTTDYTSSEVADMMRKGEGVNVSNGEVTPTQGGGIRVLQKAGKSESPKDKVIKDGEMSEGKKKKKSKYNPWAICTSQLGREFKTTERSEWSAKQKNKYERCVKQVKQDVREGKNPYLTIVESKIEDIIKETIQGKISKKNLLSLLDRKRNFVSESPDPTTKPKPGTKPAPTTDPDFDPFNDPDPNDDPEASSKGLNLFMSKVKKAGLIKKKRN